MMQTEKKPLSLDGVLSSNALPKEEDEGLRRAAGANIPSTPMAIALQEGLKGYGAERGLPLNKVDTENGVRDTLAVLGITRNSSEADENSSIAEKTAPDPAPPTKNALPQRTPLSIVRETTPTQKRPSSPKEDPGSSLINKLRELRSEVANLSAQERDLEKLWKEHNGFDADQQARFDLIRKRKSALNDSMRATQREMLNGASTSPTPEPAPSGEGSGNGDGPPKAQPPETKTLPVTDLEDDVHVFDPREAAEAHMIATGDIHKFDPKEAAAAHTRALEESPVTVPVLDTETTPIEATASVTETQPVAPANIETRFESALRKIHAEDPERALRILNTTEGKNGPAQEKFLKLLAATEKQKDVQEKVAEEKLEKKAFDFIKRWGEKYQKIPLPYKVALGVTLAGGALLSTGALSAVFATGVGVRRLLSGAATTVTTEAALQRFRERKGGTRTEPQGTFDRRVALMLGALVGGGGYVIEGVEHASAKIASIKASLDTLYGHVQDSSSLGLALGGGAGSEQFISELKDGAPRNPTSFPYTPATPSPELAQAISGNEPVLDIPKPPVGAPITFTQAEATGSFDAESFHKQLVENMKQSLSGDTPSFADATVESVASTPDVPLEKIAVSVKAGDNLWNILKDELAKQHKLDGLTPEKQNYLIDSMKDKFAAMSSGQLNDIGFKSGDIDVLHVGEKLDLSSVLESDVGTAHAVTPTVETPGWVHEEMPNTPTPALVDLTAEPSPAVEMVTNAEPRPLPSNEPYFESDHDRLVRRSYGMSPQEALGDPVMGEHIRRAIGGVLNQIYSPHDGQVFVLGGATKEWYATKGLSAYQLIYRPEALTSPEFPDVGISEKTESLRTFAKDIMQRTHNFPTKTESIEEYLRRSVAENLLKRRRFGGL